MACLSPTPSRNHRFGWEAEAGVDKAREQVAALLGADEKEIVFTSGSTESNNIAIKGAAYMSIAAELEKHAAEELSHALTVAKQIDYLGGEITAVPKPVKSR